MVKGRTEGFIYTFLSFMNEREDNTIVITIKNSCNSDFLGNTIGPGSYMGKGVERKPMKRGTQI